LNELNIPSPDAGRTRTDHGAVHEVSGRWSVSTVRELCMNRAILGLLDYGRRSEGKHRRLGKDGARLLEDSDRNGQKKPKVIMNSPSLVVTSRLPEGPQFDPARWEKIQAETQKRSKVQRGVPRPRDPARYHLSCRLIDLTDDCGSVMYGHKHGKRLVYTCGEYMKTGGADCENNTVDAEAVLAFTLDTLWELTDRLGSRDRLREKLIERAAVEQPQDPHRLQREQQRARLQASVAKLERDRAAARRNYATEEDPTFREMVRGELTKIELDLVAVKDQIASIPELRSTVQRSPEEETERALALLDDIRRIARDPAARSDVLPLAQRLGMWLGMRFVDATKKTRRVRRLAGGMIAFGDEPFPGSDGDGTECPDADLIHPKDGVCRPAASARKNTQEPKFRKDNSSGTIVPPESFESEMCPQEGVSFTKGSRGDWI
jgi:hypothetical protein